MSDTPIWDFAEGYRRKNPLRFHMPGHKGQPLLGPEPWDLTEITGADCLSQAEGIIAESQAQASALYGCPTFYSTEGSSLCIRAMLYLATRRDRGRALVLAGRNAHKTFLSAAALLDFDLAWLFPQKSDPLEACTVTPEALEQKLGALHPDAVYLTAPDYLGNLPNLRTLAEVCHRHGALLLVDNAHGAYLKFLPESRHPIDLGADLCCSSAHKTLPVLTGGAYLHIAEPGLAAEAPQALALFASTSPSYLILQSLDLVNPYLKDLPDKIQNFLPKVTALKEALAQKGFRLTGQEPLKLTLAPKSYGYLGTELAKYLETRNIFPEFADPDHLVFMLSPQNSDGDLSRLFETLSVLPRRTSISTKPPVSGVPETIMSPREACLSPHETLPAQNCLGRIWAVPTVSCPPAIPILMCGERIDETALQQFAYYGISHCCVVKKEVFS